MWNLCRKRILQAKHTKHTPCKKQTFGQESEARKSGTG